MSVFQIGNQENEDKRQDQMSVILRDREVQRQVFAQLRQILVHSSQIFTPEMVSILTTKDNSKPVSAKDLSVLPQVWFLGTQVFSQEENGKYKKTAMKKLLKEFLSAKMSVLLLQNNYVPTLPKQLAFCRSYPTLKILNLSNNNICNIEALCRLNAPELEALNIGRFIVESDNNFIRSLHNLKHLSFPKLKILNLQNNQFLSLFEMEYANFPQINSLVLDTNSKLIECLQILKMQIFPVNTSIKHLESKALRASLKKVKRTNFLKKNVNLEC